MTTICSKCGNPLAATDRFCSRCGESTGSYYANSGTSSYEPTSLIAPNTTPSQTSPPATDYGSNPYGVSLQNPYEPFNPYETPLPSPSPAPTPAPLPLSPSRRPKLGLLIGILVLVLIIVSVSVVALLTQYPKNTSTGDTSSSTATSVQTSIPTTVTAHAEKNPYSPNTGTLVLDDPLIDNSRGYGWDGGVLSDGSSCTFTGTAYQANQTNPQYIHPCFAETTNFNNFAYELKMTILKGDCGGLIFRADSANSKYYVFDVCQDGTFSLFYYSGFGQSGTYLLSPQSSSTINTGLNQANLIAIVANRSTLDLYVNSLKFDSVDDNTYSHGAIGVIADPSNNHPTQVVYSNAKVWALP